MNIQGSSYNPASTMQGLGNITKPSGQILSKDYKNATGLKGNSYLGSNSSDVNNFSGKSFKVNYSGNNSNDTLDIDNTKGYLKNTKGVLKTDKNDKITLEGNWKETKDFTDTTSGETGNLYEDGNGNQFLVTGGAKVETNADRMGALGNSLNING